MNNAGTPTRLTISAAAMLGVIGLSGMANAADDLPSRAELWKLIQQQQKQIEALQQKLGAASEEVKAVAKAQADSSAKSGAAAPEWTQRISLSGKMEVDAVTSNDLNNDWNATTGDSSSDIVVSTVEVDVAAQMNSWASAHTTLKYEEDADGSRIQFDAGSITIGNTERYPVWLTAGKETLPFGAFPSAAFADSLPKTIGEMGGETAVILGATASGFTGQGYAFNGDSRVSGDTDDTLGGYGIMLSYGGEVGAVGVDAAVSYVNSIEDGNISDTLGTGGAAGNVDAIAKRIGAWDAHLSLSMAGFTLTGEYFTAAERFAAAELAWNGQGAKPRAWHLELAYDTEIKSYPVTFAVAYDGTDEALDLGQPEDRWLAIVNVAILDGVSLGLEYMHSEDYATSKTGARVAAGAGDDRDQVTMRLAAEF
ncbi:LbtU family siderophore porin [Magnetofaba australis]|uniref:Porin n=1 Tax=Magnetofaba australis IT-1 TaxID=1434232 RepID=A0A1Y2K167_9PROT|nr:LbtU family siderophore porin [Magnetofaba australis]OSM01366.1 hypothetical protein MAIT1_01302 [Magnetofaba australis IT-1]